MSKVMPLRGGGKLKGWQWGIEFVGSCVYSLLGQMVNPSSCQVFLTPRVILLVLRKLHIKYFSGEKRSASNLCVQIFFCLELLERRCTRAPIAYGRMLWKTKDILALGELMCVIFAITFLVYLGVEKWKWQRTEILRLPWSSFLKNFQLSRVLDGIRGITGNFQMEDSEEGL